MKSPEFAFKLIFFKKFVLITNEDDYVTLTISVLNALSIWLNLCVLDLHKYLFKVRIVFIFFYEILLKLKVYLIRQISLLN